MAILHRVEGIARRDLGDLDGPRTSLRAAVDHATVAGDRALAAAAQSSWAFVMARLGDLDAAIEAFHAAEPDVSGLERARLLNHLGVTLYWKGNLSEAAATLTVASDELALFDPVSEAKARLNLGAVLAEIARFDDAETQLRRVIADGESRGGGVIVSLAYENLGFLAVLQRRPACSTRTPRDGRGGTPRRRELLATAVGGPCPRSRQRSIVRRRRCIAATGPRPLRGPGPRCRSRDQPGHRRRVAARAGRRRGGDGCRGGGLAVVSPSGATGLGIDRRIVATPGGGAFNGRRSPDAVGAARSRHRPRWSRLGIAMRRAVVSWRRGWLPSRGSKVIRWTRNSVPRWLVGTRQTASSSPMSTPSPRTGRGDRPAARRAISRGLAGRSGEPSRPSVRSRHGRMRRCTERARRDRGAHGGRRWAAAGIAVADRSDHG